MRRRTANEGASDEQGMANVRNAIVFSVLLAGLTAGLAAADPAPEEPGTTATVAVQQVPIDHTLPDEAMMMLVGTGLIALAAAVRRAR